MKDKLLNWIFNAPIFAEHRMTLLEEATRRGSMDAFTKAHADIMETMADDTEKRAKELAKETLDALLLPISFDDVLSIDPKKGFLFLGKEHADDARLANLKSEAEFLVNTDLWKVLHETPKALAEKAMFVSGESLDDLKKGRSMLYVLSNQKRVVDLLISVNK